MSRLEEVQAEQMRVIYEGLRKAKQEENEACAKIAEEIEDSMAEEIARRIRARFK